MKVVLISEGARRPCTLPHKECDHVVAEGACPHCKATPFKVAGGGMQPSADDQAYEATARALCCGKGVGTLRAEMNTLFGVEEDERVLNGRCRVY
jgi:hypothetical protein